MFKHNEVLRKVKDLLKVHKNNSEKLLEDLINKTMDGSYKFVDGIAGVDGVIRDDINKVVVTLPPCTLINVEIGPLSEAGDSDGFTLQASSGGISLRTFDKVTGIRVKKWYGIQPVEFGGSVMFKLLGDKTRSVGVPVRFYYKV